MRLPDFNLKLRLPFPPFWMIAVLIVLVVLTWIPLVLIARRRVTKSSEPRIHMFLDMDNQAKLKTQSASPVFADNRAMRPPPPGTVARGRLEADDHYYRGYRSGSDSKSAKGDKTPNADKNADMRKRYFHGLPDQIELNSDLLKTGRRRFNIYCSPCHGESGYGNGAVQQRANDLVERGNTGTNWTQVANLNQLNQEGQLTFGRELYPDGKVFNTISNGKGAMPSYDRQIPTHDRWAIVAYLRALQSSQSTKVDQLTSQQRRKLNEQKNDE